MLSKNILTGNGNVLLWNAELSPNYKELHPRKPYSPMTY
jgi:hypothetical protein